jgi:hypothetical protein
LSYSEKLSASRYIQKKAFDLSTSLILASTPVICMSSFTPVMNCGTAPVMNSPTRTQGGDAQWFELSVQRTMCSNVWTMGMPKWRSVWCQCPFFIVWIMDTLYAYDAASIWSISSSRRVSLASSPSIWSRKSSSCLAKARLQLVARETVSWSPSACTLPES